MTIEEFQDRLNRSIPINQQIYTVFQGDPLIEHVMKLTYCSEPLSVENCMHDNIRYIGCSLKSKLLSTTELFFLIYIREKYNVEFMDAVINKINDKKLYSWQRAAPTEFVDFITKDFEVYLDTLKVELASCIT